MTKDLAGPYPDIRWFEDYTVGQRFVFGAWEMMRDDMLAFARSFDPEPFHTDDKAARALGWGGLIASGPHVAAIFRRLAFDAFPNVEMVISPGWDRIRWRMPVFAGDVLTAHSEVIETRALASRPGEGLVRMHNQIRRQNDDVVTEITASLFARMRP